MEINLLIFVGYLLRVAYHYLNENYSFSWKTDEGKKNIKRSIFSGLISGLVTFLFFWVHSDDHPANELVFARICVTYLGLGWSISSIWNAAMNLIEQKFLNKLNNFGTETKTEVVSKENTPQ